MARLAARQHGVVAFRQLLELGLGRDAVQHWVKSGRLHRVHRGVYAVGYARVSAEGRDMAAVLACGPGAVLSHWTAAARWELLRPTGPACVLSPKRCSIPGLNVRVATALHPDDCAKRDEIPITSVARTLLDIAAVADGRILRRAVNQADRQRRLNRRAIHELLGRNPGRAGTGKLRAAIAAVDPTTRRTRSDLEVDFLALCRRYDIERPVSNAKVAGYEVDMHWPGTRLIVEIDSYEYHRTPAEFHNDRRRDADLATQGYVVIRVSDYWLATDPRGVAETIRYVLTSGSIASSE